MNDVLNDHGYISSIMDKMNIHKLTSSIIHEIAMHCHVNDLDLIPLQ